MRYFLAVAMLMLAGCGQPQTKRVTAYDIPTIVQAASDQFQKQLDDVSSKVKERVNQDDAIIDAQDDIIEQETQIIHELRQVSGPEGEEVITRKRPKVIAALHKLELAEKVKP